MRKLILFEIGDRQYAVDLPCVTSIDQDRYGKRIGVSEGPAATAVPALDLRRFLSDRVLDTPKPKDAKRLLLTTSGGSCAVIVDRVGSALTFDPADLHPLPSVFPSEVRDLLPSAFLHRNTPVLLLDAEAVGRLIFGRLAQRSSKDAIKSTRAAGSNAPEGEEFSYSIASDIRGRLEAALTVAA